MKIRYKYQRFQADAARAVVSAFAGQPKSDGFSDFIIDQGTGKGAFNVEGFGNKSLIVSREMVADNVRAVQTEQGLKPIDSLEGDGFAFTIDMETGTGKTYTYIKTMYELNAKYGWTKFIVIVPSIAIREGVLKSFQSMEEHFMAEYGKRMQYFVYNSKQLSKIDGYAQDPGLHVMIINTQAFNTSLNEDKNVSGRAGDNAARIIFSRRDEFRSRRPIDIISKTNPIVIIDEPQSVLGANKDNSTRKGIKLFNPLFMLLYSATHRKDDIYNMVYRLDAMDAYNKKLVKKIEVKGIKQVGSTATNGYIYLEEIVITKGNPQARISFDVKTETGTKQVSRLVGEVFNVKENSGGLAEYDNNFILERIDGLYGNVKFLNGLVLYEGDAVGRVNENLLRRIQIRETIRTHIERERQLFHRKIKVLSLFFIDHVDSYRLYDSEDSRGKFAVMFEEEYAEVLREKVPSLSDSEYLCYLSNPKNASDKVHQGYFSKDKRGRMVDPKCERGTSDSSDESAFDLIMKDKERLLSFDEPVRFIFSHSALKEGWDNPNVFQICTLKDTANEIKKRQEVGRGMRLCVNDKGERQDRDVLGDHVFDTNVLTVIASESYESFSKKLQTEIAEACDTRPVIINSDLFKNLSVTKSDGSKYVINDEEAIELHESLIGCGYVKNGKLTQKYYDDKKSDSIEIGDAFKEIKESVVARLDQVFDPSAVAPSNARGPVEANFNKDYFAKSEFQNLWTRINMRTYYNVSFDTSDLIKTAVKSLDDNLKVTEIRIVVEGGVLNKIESKEALENGTAMEEGKAQTVHVTEAVGGSVKYDLVGELVEKTGLTRKSIIGILKGVKPGTFHLFQMNPEEFIIKSARIINDAKATSVIQHITYEKLRKEFDSDIFTESTLRGKLGLNAIQSTKSLYDLVVVDSVGIEKTFAEQLEKQDDVLVYTKLPRGFYINTPLGHYNPDWAIVFKEDTVKHIYFIAETKGNSMENSELRGTEKSKIECARRHFAAISSSDVKFGVVSNYQELYDVVTK